jgi:signal peptidase I
MSKLGLMREVRAWAAMLLGVLAFRTFAYEPVHVPSGSMIPSLQVGDYVIVEKWAYGARLPFTATAQVTWATPQRGDIVVLLAPSGNPRDDDLIKRVVAVAGDKVEIRAGHLVVNGRPVPRTQISGACSYWDEAEGGRWHEEPCLDWEERLGSHRYHTYCSPDLPCGDVPEQQVPPGMVWVAGDHRDHSADSRVFGPVPVGRIKGRAWMALASWGPDGPRWRRTLHRVNE